MTQEWDSEERWWSRFVCVSPLIIAVLQAKPSVPPFHTMDHTHLSVKRLTHIYTHSTERDQEFGATSNHFGEVKRNAHIYFLILSYFPVTKKNSLPYAFVCVLVFVLLFLKKNNNILFLHSIHS